MATKPSEPNKFIALKKIIASLHKDISFLKNCLKLKLTPVSHKIKVRSPTHAHLIQKIEREHVKESIKTLYSKLNIKNLECYNLHLKLAKQYPAEFPSFLTKVKVAEKCESERKRLLHVKKLNLLKFRSDKVKSDIVKSDKVKVQPLEGFVVNRSSQEFSSEQVQVLQNGLNYALTSKPDLNQIIIDLETAIDSCQISLDQKNTARTFTEDTLKTLEHTPNTHETNIIKELKDKPVFYTKADKGNAIVILDKINYDNLMIEKLNNGPYRKQRKDPLTDIVKKVDKTIKECKPIFENLPRLKISNPTLPRIRGQPKIHKPGNEIREIISAEGSPTHKIAKWLVKEFQTLYTHTQTDTRQVQNTKQFIEKLQNSGNIEEDEIMVSFDVAALFPSVPVKEAIVLLEDWLLRQKSDATWKTKVRTYLKLTRLCIEENYFTFRGEYYKQTKGTPMGNPLSPFLCELFMANLEKDLKEKGAIPERWWRYVDDIFSIIRKDALPSILEAINSAHRDIKFTCEQEKDGKLPFLDVLIVRESNQMNFEIYRKPTHTQRVIPNTSNHSHQHKAAAFQHMIHRLETFPLSVTGKQKELNYIFETARLNGYSTRTIQAIIDKHRKTQYRKSLTTLSPITNELRRVSVNFDHNITRPLRSKFRKIGIELVFSSRNNQLKTLLGSTKDPVDALGKSGVYKISCPHCDKIYIGQTKRTLDTRFKEHLAEVTKANKDTEKGIHYHFKSKVAEHIFNEDHQLTKDNISLLRQIQNPWKLDVAESLEIYKQKQINLLNKDQGNGYTWLFRLLPTGRRRIGPSDMP